MRHELHMILKATWCQLLWMHRTMHQQALGAICNMRQIYFPRVAVNAYRLPVEHFLIRNTSARNPFRFCSLPRAKHLGCRLLIWLISSRNSSIWHNLTHFLICKRPESVLFSIMGALGETYSFLTYYRSEGLPQRDISSLCIMRERLEAAGNYSAVVVVGGVAAPAPSQCVCVCVCLHVF